MTVDSENKLKNLLEKYKDITLTAEDNKNVLTVSKDILKDDLLGFLKELYDLEKQLSSQSENNIILNLKDLSTELLTEAISFSLNDEELVDPIMILNITNLIKVYNTLDDSFFENKYVYVKDIEELLDLRINLQEQLESFVKQFSIYFLSLFKSFNKDHYTPLDIHKPLPKIYKIIFMSNDLLTLSGIFATTKPISTEDCIYLEDGIECMLNIQAKSMISSNLIQAFLKDIPNDLSSK